MDVLVVVDAPEVVQAAMAVLAVAEDVRIAVQEAAPVAVLEDALAVVEDALLAVVAVVEDALLHHLIADVLAEDAVLVADSVAVAIANKKIKSLKREKGE